MNADDSRAYIGQVLVTTLTPGDIVIMDNLPAHTLTGANSARSPLQQSVSAATRDGRVRD